MGCHWSVGFPPLLGCWGEPSCDFFLFFFHAGAGRKLASESDKLGLVLEDEEDGERRLFDEEKRVMENLSSDDAWRWSRATTMVGKVDVDLRGEEEGGAGPVVQGE